MDVISLDKFNEELEYGLDKTYRRAKKNGIAHHTIKLSPLHKLSIRYRVDRKNPSKFVSEFRLNHVEFNKEAAVNKAKDLINLTVKLAKAETEAAIQAKKKGAGRVVIQLGATKRIVVLSRVSARNQAGATFRYEMNGQPKQRESLFDFLHENGRRPETRGNRPGGPLEK